MSHFRSNLWRQSTRNGPRREAARRGAESTTMNEKTRNRVWKWRLIGLSGAAALALAAGGYWFDRQEGDLL